MPRDLAKAVGFVRYRHELDVARCEERVLAGVDLSCGLQHAYGVLVAALAAEDESEAEYQDHRHQDVPCQRAAVAQELAVASDEDGLDSFQHRGISLTGAANGR